MDDEKYWKDVEKAYSDCLMEGMTLPLDKLWEFAKKRTEHRYFLQRVKERALREGLDFDSLLRQENALRREAERKNEECRRDQEVN